MMQTTTHSTSYASGLDGWSPLALHQQDLVGAQSQRQALTTFIAEWWTQAEIGSPVQSAAWTGDRIRSAATVSPLTPQGADTTGSPVQSAAWTGDQSRTDEHVVLHDPRLTWLVRSLAAEVWSYLTRLGHDSAMLDARIRSVQPVISSPGQCLPAHAHGDADLCAVYYVDAPADSGDLRFLNSTRGEHADYAPVDGRLLLFPARQRHEVLENRSDRVRLSISFELEIVAQKDDTEYRTVPGAPQHRVLPRPAASGSIERCVAAMVNLDQLRHPGESPDSFDELMEQKPHMAGLPPDTATWNLFRLSVGYVADAIDAAGLDRSAAATAAPSVSWRRNHHRSPFATAPTDLQVYLRLDEAHDTCVVEYEDGEPLTSLDQGRIVLVDGRRSHRVLGKGLVMRFGVDLGADIDPSDLHGMRAARETLRV